MCTVSKWTFDVQSMTQAQAVVICCGTTFDLIWCIIGSVLLTQLSYDCENSAVGFMIFAYIIIKWIYVGCRFLFLVFGCQSSDNPHLKLRYFSSHQNGYGTHSLQAV